MVRLGQGPQDKDASCQEQNRKQMSPNADEHVCRDTNTRDRGAGGIGDGRGGSVRGMSEGVVYFRPGQCGPIAGPRSP